MFAPFHGQYQSLARLVSAICCLTAVFTGCAIILLGVYYNNPALQGVGGLYLIFGTLFSWFVAKLVFLFSGRVDTGRIIR